MKSRITVKEIDDLCPSFDKPLTLKTDNKRAYERYKTIKIISPSVKNSFSAICSYGELRIIGAEDLLLYPSLKPEEPNWGSLNTFDASKLNGKDGVLRVDRDGETEIISFNPEGSDVLYILFERKISENKTEEPKFKEVVRYVPVFYEGDLGYSKSFETIDECMEQETSYSKMPAIGYKPVTVYLKGTDNE